MLEKETYFELDSIESLEVNNFISKIRSQNTNPYMFYSVYHNQMAYLYGRVEKRETLINGSWTATYFNKSGQVIDR